MYINVPHKLILNKKYSHFVLNLLFDDILDDCVLICEFHTVGE